MGLFRRRAARNEALGDPDDRSPQLGVKYKDLALMGQLLEAGADLKEPRHVIYYNYAPSSDVGRTMATEAEIRGFAATVEEPLPKYPGQWLVRCEMTTALLPDFVRDTTDFFEDLAFRHQAEYDGWEAAV